MGENTGSTLIEIVDDDGNTEEIINWKNCAVVGCGNGVSYRLNSKYCHPHSMGMKPIPQEKEEKGRTVGMADIIYFQDEMHRRNQPDNAHVYLDENGVLWYEYQYEYEYEDKKYGYSLWAKSWEDAANTLKAMSEGKITGQIYWSGN